MSDDFVEEVIAVPDDIVETILGENGDWLDNLSEETGVFLILNPQGDNLSELILSGSTTQVSHAKELFGSFVEKIKKTNEINEQNTDVERHLSLEIDATETKDTPQAACSSSENTSGYVDSSESNATGPPGDPGSDLPSPPSTKLHGAQRKESGAWEDDFSWAWAYNKETHEKDISQEKSSLKQWLTTIIHSPLEERLTSMSAGEEDTEKCVEGFSVDPSAAVGSLVGVTTRPYSTDQNSSIDEISNVSKENNSAMVNIALAGRNEGSKMTTLPSPADTFQNASGSNSSHQKGKKVFASGRQSSDYDVSMTSEINTRFSSSVDNIDQVGFDPGIKIQVNPKISNELRVFSSSVDRIDQIGLDLSRTNRNHLNDSSSEYGLSESVNQTGFYKTINNKDDDLSSSVDDLSIYTDVHLPDSSSKKLSTHSTNISSHSHKFRNRRENPRSSRYHSNPEFFSHASSYLKSHSETHLETQDDFSSSVDDLSKIVPNLAEGSSVDNLNEFEGNKSYDDKIGPERYQDPHIERENIPRDDQEINPLKQIAFAGLSLTINPVVNPIVIKSGTPVDGIATLTTNGVKQNTLDLENNFDRIDESFESLTQNEGSSVDGATNDTLRISKQLMQSDRRHDRNKKTKKGASVRADNLITDRNTSSNQIFSSSMHECHDKKYFLSTTIDCPWKIDSKTGKLYKDNLPDQNENSKQQHHFTRLLFDPPPKTLNLMEHDVISTFSNSKERPAIFTRRKALLARRSTRYITSCERATKHLRRQSTVFINIGGSSSKESAIVPSKNVEKSQHSDENQKAEFVQNNIKYTTGDNQINTQPNKRIEKSSEEICFRETIHNNFVQINTTGEKNNGFLSSLTIQSTNEIKKATETQSQQPKYNPRTTDLDFENIGDNKNENIYKRSENTTEAMEADDEEVIDALENKLLNTTDDPTLLDRPDSREALDDQFIKPIVEANLAQKVEVKEESEYTDPDFKDSFNDNDDVDIGTKVSSDSQNDVTEPEIIPDEVPDALDDPDIIDRPISPEAVDDEMVAANTLQEKERAEIDTKQQQLIENPQVIDSEDTESESPAEKEPEEIYVEKMERSVLIPDQSESIELGSEETREAIEAEDEEVIDALENKLLNTTDDPTLLDRPDSREALDDQFIKPIVEANLAQKVEVKEESEYTDPDFKDSFNDNDDVDIGTKVSSDSQNDVTESETNTDEVPDALVDPDIIDRPISPEAVDDEMVAANTLQEKERAEIDTKQQQLIENPQVIDSEDTESESPAEKEPEEIYVEKMERSVLIPDQSESIELGSEETREAIEAEDEEVIDALENKLLNTTDDPTLLDRPDSREALDDQFIKPIVEANLAQKVEVKEESEYTDPDFKDSFNDNDDVDIGTKVSSDSQNDVTEPEIIPDEVPDALDDPDIIDRPISPEAVDDEMVAANTLLEKERAEIDTKQQQLIENPQVIDSEDTESESPAEKEPEEIYVEKMERSVLIPDQSESIELGSEEIEAEDEEVIDALENKLLNTTDDPTLLDRPDSREALDDQFIKPIVEANMAQKVEVKEESEYTDPDFKDSFNDNDDVDIGTKVSSDSQNDVTESETNTDEVPDALDDPDIIDRPISPEAVDDEMVAANTLQDKERAEIDTKQQQLIENPQVIDSEDTESESPAEKEPEEIYVEKMERSVLLPDQSESIELGSEETREAIEAEDEEVIDALENKLLNTTDDPTLLDRPNSREALDDQFIKPIVEANLAQKVEVKEESEYTDPDFKDSFNDNDDVDIGTKVSSDSQNDVTEPEIIPDEVPDALDDPDIIDRPISPEAVDDEMVAANTLLEKERAEIDTKQQQLIENPQVIDSEDTESESPAEKEPEEIYVEKMERSVLIPDQSESIELGSEEIEAEDEEVIDALENKLLNTTDDPTLLDRPDSREALDDQFIKPIVEANLAQKVEVKEESEYTDPDFKDSFNDNDDVDIGTKVSSDSQNDVTESKIIPDEVPDALDDPAIIDRPISPEAVDDEMVAANTLQEKERAEIDTKQQQLIENPQVIDSEDTESESPAEKEPEEIYVEKMERSVLIPDQSESIELGSEETREAIEGEDEEVIDALENKLLNTTDDPTLLDRPESREALDDQFIKPIVEANLAHTHEVKEEREYTDPDFKDSFNDNDDVDIGTKVSSDSQNDVTEPEIIPDEVPDALDDPDIIDRPISPEAVDDEMVAANTLQEKERAEIDTKQQQLIENPQVIDSEDTESESPAEKEPEEIYVEKMERSVLIPNQSESIELGSEETREAIEAEDEEVIDALENKLLNTTDDPTLLDRPDSREALDDQFIKPIVEANLAQKVEVKEESEYTDPDFKDSFNDNDDVDIGTKVCSDSQNDVTESETNTDEVPDALDDPDIIDRPISPEAVDDEMVAANTLQEKERAEIDTNQQQLIENPQVIDSEDTESESPAEKEPEEIYVEKMERSVLLPDQSESIELGSEETREAIEAEDEEVIDALENKLLNTTDDPTLLDRPDSREALDDQFIKPIVEANLAQKVEVKEESEYTDPDFKDSFNDNDDVDIGTKVSSDSQNDVTESETNTDEVPHALDDPDIIDRPISPEAVDDEMVAANTLQEKERAEIDTKQQQLIENPQVIDSEDTESESPAEKEPEEIYVEKMERSVLLPDQSESIELGSEETREAIEAEDEEVIDALENKLLNTTDDPTLLDRPDSREALDDQFIKPIVEANLAQKVEVKEESEYTDPDFKDSFNDNDDVDIGTKVSSDSQNDVTESETNTDEVPHALDDPDIIDRPISPEAVDDEMVAANTLQEKERAEIDTKQQQLIENPQVIDSEDTESESPAEKEPEEIYVEKMERSVLIPDQSESIELGSEETREAIEGEDEEVIDALENKLLNTTDDPTLLDRPESREALDDQFIKPIVEANLAHTHEVKEEREYTDPDFKDSFNDNDDVDIGTKVSSDSQNDVTEPEIIPDEVPDALDDPDIIDRPISPEAVDDEMVAANTLQEKERAEIDTKQQQLIENPQVIDSEDTESESPAEKEPEEIYVEKMERSVLLPDQSESIELGSEETREAIEAEDEEVIDALENKLLNTTDDPTLLDRPDSREALDDQFIKPIVEANLAQKVEVKEESEYTDPDFKDSFNDNDDVDIGTKVSSDSQNDVTESETNTDEVPHALDDPDIIDRPISPEAVDDEMVAANTLQEKERAEIDTKQQQLIENPQVIDSEDTESESPAEKEPEEIYVEKMERSVLLPDQSESIELGSEETREAIEAEDEEVIDALENKLLNTTDDPTLLDRPDSREALDDQFIKPIVEANLAQKVEVKEESEYTDPDFKDSFNDNDDVDIGTKVSSDSQNDVTESETNTDEVPHALDDPDIIDRPISPEAVDDEMVAANTLQEKERAEIDTKQQQLIENPQVIDSEDTESESPAEKEPEEIYVEKMERSVLLPDQSESIELGSEETREAIEAEDEEVIDALENKLLNTTDDPTLLDRPDSREALDDQFIKPIVEANLAQKVEVKEESEYTDPDFKDSFNDNDDVDIGTKVSSDSQNDVTESETNTDEVPHALDDPDIIDRPISPEAVDDEMVAANTLQEKERAEIDTKQQQLIENPQVIDSEDTESESPAEKEPEEIYVEKMERSVLLPDQSESIELGSEETREAIEAEDEEVIDALENKLLNTTDDPTLLDRPDSREALDDQFIKPIVEANLAQKVEVKEESEYTDPDFKDSFNDNDDVDIGTKVSSDSQNDVTEPEIIPDEVPDALDDPDIIDRPISPEAVDDEMVAANTLLEKERAEIDTKQQQLIENPQVIDSEDTESESPAEKEPEEIYVEKMEKSVLIPDQSESIELGSEEIEAEDEEVIDALENKLLNTTDDPTLLDRPDSREALDDQFIKPIVEANLAQKVEVKEESEYTDPDFKDSFNDNDDVDIGTKVCSDSQNDVTESETNTDEVPDALDDPDIIDRPISPEAVDDEMVAANTLQEKERAEIDTNQQQLIENPQVIDSEDTESESPAEKEPEEIYVEKMERSVLLPDQSESIELGSEETREAIEAEDEEVIDALENKLLNTTDDPTLLDRPDSREALDDQFIKPIVEANLAQKVEVKEESEYTDPDFKDSFNDNDDVDIGTKVSSDSQNDVTESETNTDEVPHALDDPDIIDRPISPEAVDDEMVAANTLQEKERAEIDTKQQQLIENPQVIDSEDTESESPAEKEPEEIYVEKMERSVLLPDQSESIELGSEETREAIEAEDEEVIDALENKLLNTTDDPTLLDRPDSREALDDQFIKPIVEANLAQNVEVKEESEYTDPDFKDSFNDNDDVDIGTKVSSDSQNDVTEPEIIPNEVPDALDDPDIIDRPISPEAVDYEMVAANTLLEKERAEIDTKQQQLIENPQVIDSEDTESESPAEKEPEEIYVEKMERSVLLPDQSESIELGSEETQEAIEAEDEEVIDALENKLLNTTDDPTLLDRPDSREALDDQFIKPIVEANMAQKVEVKEESEYTDPDFKDSFNDNDDVDIGTKVSSDIQNDVTEPEIIPDEVPDALDDPDIIDRPISPEAVDDEMVAANTLLEKERAEIDTKQQQLIENPQVIDSEDTESESPAEKEPEEIYVEKMERSVLIPDQSESIELGSEEIEAEDEEVIDALENKLLNTTDDPTLLDRPDSREALDDQFIKPIVEANMAQKVEVKEESEYTDPDFKDSFNDNDDVDIGTKVSSDSQNDVTESETNTDEVPDALDDPDIIDRPISPEAVDDEMVAANTLQDKERAEIDTKQQQLIENPQVIDSEDTESESPAEKEPEEIYVEKMERSVLLPDQSESIELGSEEIEAEDEEVIDALENKLLNTTDDPTLLDRPDSREALDDQFIKPIVEANLAQKVEVKEESEYTDPDFKDSFNDNDDVDIGTKVSSDSQNDVTEPEIIPDEVPDALDDPDIIDRPISPEAVDDEMVAANTLLEKERAEIDTKQQQLIENPQVIDSEDTESESPAEKEPEEIYVEKMERSVLIPDQSESIELGSEEIEAEDEEVIDALENKLLNTTDDPTLLDRPDSREALDDQFIKPIVEANLAQKVEVKEESEYTDPDFKDSFNDNDDVDIGTKVSSDSQNDVTEPEIIPDEVPDALDDPDIIDRPISPEAVDDEMVAANTLLEKERAEIDTKQQQLIENPQVIDSEDTESESPAEKEPEEIYVEKMERSVLIPDQSESIELGSEEIEAEDEEVTDALENKLLNTTDDPTLLDRPDSREALDDQFIKPIVEANLAQNVEVKEESEYTDPDFKDSFNDNDDVDIGTKVSSDSQNDVTESETNTDEVPHALDDPDIIDRPISPEAVDDEMVAANTLQDKERAEIDTKQQQLIENPQVIDSEDTESESPAEKEPEEIYVEKMERSVLLPDQSESIELGSEEIEAEDEEVIDALENKLLNTTDDPTLLDRPDSREALDDQFIKPIVEANLAQKVEVKEESEYTDPDFKDSFNDNDDVDIGTKVSSDSQNDVTEPEIIPDEVPDALDDPDIIDRPISPEAVDDEMVAANTLLEKERAEIDTKQQQLIENPQVIDSEDTESESPAEKEPEEIYVEKMERSVLIPDQSESIELGSEEIEAEDEEVIDALENKLLNTIDDPTLLDRPDSREALDDQFIKPIVEANLAQNVEVKEESEYTDPDFKDSFNDNDDVDIGTKVSSDFQNDVTESEIIPNEVPDALDDPDIIDGPISPEAVDGSLVDRSYNGDGTCLDSSDYDEHEDRNEELVEVHSMVSALSRRMSCPMESYHMVMVMDEVNTIVDKVNIGLREGSLTSCEVISEISRITQLRPEPEIEEENEDQNSSSSIEGSSRSGKSEIKQTEQQIFDLLDEIVILLRAVNSSTTHAAEADSMQPEQCRQDEEVNVTSGLKLSKASSNLVVNDLDENAEQTHESGQKEFTTLSQKEDTNSRKVTFYLRKEDLLEKKEEMDKNVLQVGNEDEEMKKFHFDIEDKQAVDVVAEDKQDVDTAVGEKQDVDVVEKKQDVDVVEEKQDVDVVEEKQDVDAVEEKQDVDVVEEKQDVDVVEEKQDVDVVEEKQDVDVVEQKQDVDVVEEKQDVNVAVEKREDVNVVKEDKQDIDVVKEEKQDIDVVKEEKEDVDVAVEEKQDVDVVEEKHDVDVVEEKQDVDVAVEDKQYVDVVEEKQDIDVVEEKLDVDVVEEKQDVDVAVEDKQDVDVAVEEREDVNVVKEDKQDIDVVKEEKQDIDVAVEDKQDVDMAVEEKEDVDVVKEEKQDFDVVKDEKEDVDVAFEDKQDVDVAVEDKQDVDVDVENKQDVDVAVEEKQDVGVAVEEKQDVGVAVEEKQDVGVAVEEKQYVDVAVEDKQDVNVAVEEREDVNVVKEDKPDIDFVKEEKQDVDVAVEDKQDVNVAVEEREDVNVVKEDKQDIDFVKEEKQDVDVAVEDKQDVDVAVEERQDVDVAVEEKQDVDVDVEDKQDVDVAVEEKQDVNVAVEEKQVVDVDVEDKQDVDVAVEEKQDVDVAVEEKQDVDVAVEEKQDVDVDVEEKQDVDLTIEYKKKNTSDEEDGEEEDAYKEEEGQTQQESNTEQERQLEIEEISASESKTDVKSFSANEQVCEHYDSQVQHDTASLDLPHPVVKQIKTIDTKQHFVDSEYQLTDLSCKTHEIVPKDTHHTQDEEPVKKSQQRTSKEVERSMLLKTTQQDVEDDDDDTDGDSDSDLASGKTLSKSQKRRLRKIKSKAIKKRDTRSGDSDSPDKQQEVDNALKADKQISQSSLTSTLSVASEHTTETKQLSFTEKSSTHVFTQSKPQSVRKEKIQISGNERGRDGHKRENKNKSSIALQQQHSQTEHQLPSVNIAVGTVEMEQASRPVPPLHVSSDDGGASVYPAISIQCETDEQVLHPEGGSQPQSQQGMGLLTIPGGSGRRSRSKSQDRSRSKSQGRPTSTSRSKSPMAPNLRRIRGESPRRKSRKHNIVIVDDKKH